MKLYLTRETLEECLETLDIFKEILEDPVQKHKLIRDVNKNLQLKLYDEGAVIYNRGEVSEGFYMVIKGKVSLCLPVYKAEALEGSYNEEKILEEQQIDTFGSGAGGRQGQGRRPLPGPIGLAGTLAPPHAWPSPELVRVLSPARGGTRTRGECRGTR